MLKYIYKDNAFLGFYNNIYCFEKIYGVIGCGLIPNHSLVILSGGVEVIIILLESKKSFI